MGVDYDAELIVGFELDTEIMKKWVLDHDIEDDTEIFVNNWISNNYKIPEKVYIDKSYYSSSLSIYFESYGNSYTDEISYYLTFYNKGPSNIKDILKIDDKILELMKQIYKDIMNEELDCEKVEDIPIFATLNVW